MDITILSDDPALRLLLSSLFSVGGYTLHVDNPNRLAATAAMICDQDLIVFDAPTGRYHEMVRLIERTRGTIDAILVLIARFRSIDDQNRLLRVGFDLCISRPFEPNAVEAQFIAVLRRLEYVRLHYERIDTTPLRTHVHHAVGNAPSPAAQPSPLSARQQEAFDLLMAGYRNREIAEKLAISEKTVEYRVSQILAKLGVRSRMELAAHYAPTRRVELHQTRSP